VSWASTDYAGAEQFDAWESALNTSHLRWDLAPGRTSAFAGRMGLKDFGGTRLVRCECDPCSGRRRTRQIRTDGTDYFGILLLLDGQERVRQNGWEATLKPRSLMIWDSTREIDFAVDSPLRKITLFVPQHRADQHRAVRRHCGEVIECGRGIPAVVAAHLASLAGELDAIDHLDGAAAVDLTVELIAAAFEARADHVVSAAQRDLRGAIEAHIRENIADTDLTPTAIAERFAISKRYLHLMFARSDRTVCQFINDTRLDRARLELTSPTSDGDTITTVAGRVGFTDPAHFSRVFKQRYGVAPRTYRQSPPETP
jgi:AraC-like DNA-binding protein